jgi:hemerythrin
MAIAWNRERMTTGVEEIDKQHQELIKHYNAFHDTMARGNRMEVALETLAFVADYAEWHFKKEEDCMRQYRCPAAAENLAAHNGLRQQLVQVKSRVKSNQMSVVDLIDLDKMLGDWIQNHICSVDVKLRECVNAPGCSNR